MKKKPKYDWSQPSLFPEYDLHPASKELREIRTGIDKNGKPYRNAVIVNTKAEFVEQARKIWGDKYDYTDSVYFLSKTPITIYCPKHDCHFRVAMAQNHVIKPHGKGKATGCPICAAEKLHGCEYGTDWRKYLKLCAKQNRVGRVVQPPSKKYRTPEQIAAEKAEREVKTEARLHEEQAYIARWKAKNLKEARFLKRLQNRYPDMYDTHLVDYKDKDNRVTLICPIHGEFRISPRNLFGDSKHKAHGCWRCAGMIPPDNRPSPMTADEFFQKMHELYDATELDFMTSEFKGMKKKVTAYCRKHGAITRSASYWIDGKGCEYCNGKFYPPLWKELAREKHGDKYKYFGDAPRIGQDLIHYICPKHGEITQRYNIHVNQGCGCPKCANYPNKKTPLQRCNEWIAKCIEKYGENRYDYSRAHEDYVNNDSLVWIRCCIHDHWFQQTPDNNLRTVNGSCPICSIIFRESEGEATIRRWLQKHGILDFEQEHHLPNEDPTLPLRYLSADFYMLHGCDYIIIEFHGQQHYEEIPYFYEGKSVRTFAVQQHRDRYLRQYCRNHKIQLIEIPYTDFDRIDEILTEALLGNQN